jgi:predicted ATP-dependent protease
MKIKIDELREIVRSVVQEAAKEGAIQKFYRNSYKKMIKNASSGGNKNTPPFTKGTGKLGKSGPPE